MRAKGWMVLTGSWLAAGGFFASLFVLTDQPIEPGVLRRPPPELGAGASAPSLELHVRELCDVIGPRSPRHPWAMHETAAYVASALERAGARVSRQPVRVGHPRFENVVARFGPPDRAPVVVGAHYDSFQSTVGADDNASGVAGLLELARMLGALRAPPPVELVAYALEEPPYFRTPRMGSEVHARAHRGEAIRAMIALEMIGFFRDEAGSQQYPSAYLRHRMPDRGDFIAVIGRSEDEDTVLAIRDAMSVRASLRVYGYAAPASMNGIDFSDHRSYWASGVPAVMVTDTAFLRNHAYHSRADRPERLDYERMADVVDGVFSAVLQLGADPR